MASDLLNPVNLVPNFPGKERVLAGAQEAIKSPKARKVVAFLGKPIAYDINQDYQPKGTQKKKSFLETAWHFIRRYIFTVGNAIGLGGILASIGLNFYNKSNPEGNKILQNISFVPKLLALSGVGLSAYANFFTNTTVDEYVGFDKRIAAAGVNIIDDVGEFPNEDKLADLVRRSKPAINPLRYNENESTEILLRANNPQNPAKLFLTGIAGTGKTEGMNLVAGRIIEYEATKQLKEGEKRKQVQVLRLDGTKIRNHILGLKNDDDLLSGLLSAAGIGMSSKISGPELCLAVLNGLDEKFKKAKDSNVRLVIQLDEVHELWNLARIDGKYDPEYCEKIANAFAKLTSRSENDYDILMASNLSVQGMVGLEQDFGGDEAKLKASFLAGVYRRLGEMAVEMKEPEVLTKASILAVYLRQLSHEQLEYLEPNLKGKVRAYNEDDLRDYIDGEIEKRFKDAYKDPDFILDVEELTKLQEDLFLKIRFDKSTGSTIEKIVKESTVKSNDQITLDKLIDDICASPACALTKSNIEEVSKTVGPHIIERKKELRESQVLARRAKVFEDKHQEELQTLAALDGTKLKEALRDKTVRGFVDEAIKYDTELCRALRKAFFAVYSK